MNLEEAQPAVLKGMCQRWVAKRMGVSPSAVSHYAAGRRPLGLVQLVAALEGDADNAIYALCSGWVYSGGVHPSLEAIVDRWCLQTGATRDLLCTDKAARAAAARGLALHFAAWKLEAHAVDCESARLRQLQLQLDGADGRA
jgi:predicted transcriptional regulator